MTKTVDIVKSFMTSAPVDLNELFVELGLKYEKTFDLDDDISGEIERMSQDHFVIRTNASQSNIRQRFTAAHELGHYILHKLLLGSGVDDSKAYRSDLVNGNFQNKNIKKRHETEANRFASVVLMPDPLVNAEFEKTSSINDLATTFQVSERAMEIRLKTLGLHGQR